MEQTKSQSVEVKQDRQPYQRPELVSHGKVEDLTQGTPTYCPSRPT